MTASSSQTPAYAALDSTYASLYSLLAAPAASSSHLSLLPPPALYSSITLYLSRLRPTTLPDFVKELATSQSFWHAPCIVKCPLSKERIHEDLTQLADVKGDEASLASRAYQLHLASARAVFSHIELVLANNNASIGWRSSRHVRQWVDQLASSLVDVEPPTTLMGGIALPQLAVLTGLVVGLNAYKQQNKSQQKQGLNVKPALRAAEGHWTRAFEEAMQALFAMARPAAPSSPPSDDQWEAEFTKSNTEQISIEQNRREGRAREAALAPLILAGQVSPLLSDDGLAALSPEPLLDILPLCILPLFSAPLLKLSEPRHVPNTHVLFPVLGPLSRLLSSAAEGSVLRLGGADVQRLLLGSQSSSEAGSRPGVVQRFVDQASRLEVEFIQSEASTIEKGSSQLSSAAELTAMWTALKTYLFISVQLFDAVLEGVVTTLPSPVSAFVELPTFTAQWRAGRSVPETTTNIAPYVLELLKMHILGLMKLAFVTFSISNDSDNEQNAASGESPSGSTARQITSYEIYNRFTTYRHAFYGSLEVVKSDSAASTALLSILVQTVPSMNAGIEHAWHPRAKLSIFFDVAEQLVGSIPHDLLVSTVLPLARPYLTDASYTAPFESAHSCVLAIFEAKRSPVCQELMPFYVESLLSAFPQHMSADQISHALCTVAGCLSDVDDAEAYWVVDRLEREIKEHEEKQTASSEDSLNQRRLDLQLCLIDLLPYVNLVLLRSLLATVRAYILKAVATEPARALPAPSETSAAMGSDVNTSSAPMQGSESRVATSLESEKEDKGDAREQLCARTFRALNGMDDTARQEGVRWWLENREDFGV